MLDSSGQNNRDICRILVSVCEMLAPYVYIYIYLLKQYIYIYHMNGYIYLLRANVEDFRRGTAREIP